MRFPKLILAGGLLIVLAVYSMGWSGTLHFDDEPNLDSLYGISDLHSGLRFVISGRAGPTGRPLSLATFAAQHESWPDPKPFLIFNTVLHILNAVLCFLLLRRLLGWMLEDRGAAEWLAVAVALLWVASPFLASSSLVVVQRMTGLSAFFALLALNFYANARTGYRPDSWRSNLWLASIAGIGTLLAGLAKENGFLLPAFLLLIEWLLVSNARITISPLRKGFFWIVLVAPVAVILAFLLYDGLSTTGYLYRDFTLTERLLTQPRVLFDYIFNLLIPVTESITPFHDAYRHSTGLLEPIITLFSLLALPALLVLAWLVRRSQPLVAFGLLWFFAGHLSESTLLPLELYFPHRNYLPAIGLYLALGVLAMDWLGRRDFGFPMRPLAGGVYFLVFTAVLANGTIVWGNRELASEMWYINDRDSERAAQHLYQYYAGIGEVSLAGSLIERFISNHPGKAIFSVQALAICEESQKEYLGKVDRAVQDLREERTITTSLAGLIQQFAALSKTSDCTHFGIEQAEQIADAALASNGRIYPSARQGLLFAKAQLAEYRGEYGKAIKLLKRSLDIWPALDAAVLITYFHTQNDDLEGARSFLQKTIADPPVGFSRQVVWRARLGPLLESLSTDER